MSNNYPNNYPGKHTRRPRGGGTEPKRAYARAIAQDERVEDPEAEVEVEEEYHERKQAEDTEEDEQSMHIR